MSRYDQITEPRTSLQTESCAHIFVLVTITLAAIMVLIMSAVATWTINTNDAMTDKKIIELVGQYSDCYAYEVDILGNYAYVAVGSGFVEKDGLYIIDVFDPSNPVKVGQYYTGERALGVAVSGNYAYTACDDGLYIIDVSNPSNPVNVGQYKTSSYAFNVDVSGNFAYVAGYSDGLYIIDVSDPSNPVKVGQYNTGSYA